MPHVVRRFFREAPDGRQPDVLLNLSNDGWFHGSSEHDMHLAVSVFRAVENRVPLARAVNTGISAIIDGNGRVLERLPKLKEGVLAGDRPARRPRQPLFAPGATGSADLPGRHHRPRPAGRLSGARLRPTRRGRSADSAISQIRQALLSCLWHDRGVELGRVRAGAAARSRNSSRGRRPN